MRIVFFGGAFNPPHNGHLHLAKLWSERLMPDKFLLIPTGTSPHKAAAEVSGEKRLAMCRLAAEAAGGLMEASDLEVRRQGRSYSVLTLSALHEIYPGGEFYMVVGADMFVTLETWYDFDRLKTLATFCTMPRNGLSAEQLHAYSKHLEAVGCCGMVADVPQMTLSSSDIRSRVQRSLPIAGLVPPGVEQYIYQHRLYVESFEKC